MYVVQLGEMAVATFSGTYSPQKLRDIRDQLQEFIGDYHTTNIRVFIVNVPHVSKPHDIQNTFNKFINEKKEVQSNEINSE